MALTGSNYWWLLIWLFTIGGILAVAAPKRKELICGKIEERWNILPAIFLILPYIIWAGFRDDGYGDTHAYRSTFLEVPSQLGSMSEYLSTITKDKGFAVFSVIEKSIFGNSDVIFFLIIAAVQMICLAMIYRKYSCRYWESIFLFIASTDYMSWMHNGIRQFMAISIIVAALPLLLKKKYIPLIAIILLASTFHASALIMIPVVFIVQGKAWNKKTVLCIIACLIALVFVDRFTDILDSLLMETQYSNVVTEWQAGEDDGTNPLRVLVYSIPMILSIIGRKQIKKEKNELMDIMQNFSILTFGIAILSMATSGIFLGRAICYSAIFSTPILLPWEIEHVFTRESARLIRIAMVICYIAFFYFQMHITWGIM